MLRCLLLLLLTSAAAGCRPCNERCAGGWRVFLESETTLADGRYELVLIPDAGPPLEASCVIAEQGAVATCDGGVHAVESDGSDAFDVLLFEQGGGAPGQLEVEVFRDDELWNEASIEFEREPSESCNPHCVWASASVPL